VLVGKISEAITLFMAWKILSFHHKNTGDASQTSTTAFDGIVKCYGNTWPAGLCVFCDASPTVANVQLAVNTTFLDM
jgi:hypothetical protein